MSQSIIVYLHRIPQWVDRLRNYDVFINHRFASKIAVKTTMRYHVYPGENSIYIKLDFNTSNTLVFYARPGEEVYLECGCNMGMPVTWQEVLKGFGGGLTNSLHFVRFAR